MDMDLVEEITDFVFDGAIDPREVRDFISKMNDSSEVHIPGNSKKPKKARVKPPSKAEIEYKKKRRDVNVGLANNGFGAGAGALATVQATREARKLTPKGMQASKIGRFVLRSKIPPRIAVPVAGTALVGTQLANGGLDAQSGVYFAKERATMKKPASMKQKSAIKKSMDDIINLRRMGRIDTERALELIDEIEKSYKGICSECGSDTEGSNWCEQCMEVSESTVRKSDARLMPSATRVIAPDPVSDASGIDLGWSGSISKVDTDKRQVFGWCSLTEVDGEKVVDRQGDYIPLDEVEKSAYHYVINSRKGGDMHKRDGESPLHTSDMIESFVVTPEKLENLGLERDALPHGWWVGFKVNDDRQWEEVKKGDKVSFSIHGKGRRVEKNYDDIMSGKS